MRQISEQVLYISRDSVDNALAWESRLLSAINELAETHGHAIDAAASERFGTTVRKMVFEKTYLIHYEVNEANRTIDVVQFRHGARRPF